jgi:hypothetical protein
MVAVTSADGEQFVLSETERNTTLALLVRACGEGNVTLEEFSRRTDAALTARSRADLVAVTADLGVVVPVAGRVKRHWFVPFGNRVRRGRFVLPERTTALVGMGEIHLDLRGATLVGPEPTIKCWVLMGNLRVLVPRGIHVEVDESSLFGGRTIMGYGPPPSPVTPVLRIRMLDVIGNVKVTDDPMAWGTQIVAQPMPAAPPAPAQPAGQLGGGPLEDVHPASRPEANDVSETDLGADDLPVTGLPTQVSSDLPDVGDPGGGDGVPL